MIMSNPNINYRPILDHPDYRMGLEMIQAENYKDEIYVYGGAVCDYILYQQGVIKEYQPNDFDLLIRVNAEDFSKRLDRLYESGHLKPLKEGQKPFHNIGKHSAFRVIWQKEGLKPKHIDIKCIGEDN